MTHCLSEKWYEKDERLSQSRNRSGARFLIRLYACGASRSTPQCPRRAPIRSRSTWPNQCGTRNSMVYPVSVLSRRFPHRPCRPSQCPPPRLIHCWSWDHCRPIRRIHPTTSWSSSSAEASRIGPFRNSVPEDTSRPYMHRHTRRLCILFRRRNSFLRTPLRRIRP